MNVSAELANIFLFRDFPPEELKKLATLAVERKIAAGHTLFREGDVGNEFFVIRMGTVKILKKSDQGEQEVAQLGTGSYFGEVALVSKNHQRTATVVSGELTTLLVIPREGIEKLAEEDQCFGYHFYRTMCQGLAKRLASATVDVAHFRWMATHRH